MWFEPKARVLSVVGGVTTLGLPDQLARKHSVAYTRPWLDSILNFLLNPDGWNTAKKIGVPGEETRASVTELQPANSFHIRVTAQNSLGQGAPSQELLVTTTEEGKCKAKVLVEPKPLTNTEWKFFVKFDIFQWTSHSLYSEVSYTKPSILTEPSGAPRQVRVTPDSSTSLRVTWDAPKRDEWHGTLLGYYLGHKMHDLRDNDYFFTNLEVGGYRSDNLILLSEEQYPKLIFWKVSALSQPEASFNNLYKVFKRLNPVLDCSTV